VLALAGFQTRMVVQTTEAQTRAVAMQFANELLSMARVEPDNLDCYSLPATGKCTSAVARDSTNLWGARVARGLPAAVSVRAVLNGTELSVVIGWAARAAPTLFACRW